MLATHSWQRMMMNISAQPLARDAARYCAHAVLPSVVVGLKSVKAWAKAGVSEFCAGGRAPVRDGPPG